MASQEQADYQLRCSLIGHSVDVRAVAVASNGDIVTASRDKTAKLWTEDPLNRSIYQPKVTYEGHTSYVTSVCLIPGNEEFSEGYTVTGSKDSTILVFPKLLPDPIHKLTGHTDTVSYLMWENEMLLSGSWDHSIRVWMNWDCVMHLEGHSGPVWSLAVIEAQNKEECSIISASADKTLKCWKGGKEARTYLGHTDCVRGIAVIDSERFVSCSNDAAVRLWSILGDCLATYYGHTSFIYSIYSLESCKGFVTGGEDRTLRVWDSVGNNVKTIYLPAQSVWCVAALPNSDIVAGSSDGICRVFTQSADRIADADQQSQFEESLSKFKVAVEDVGGIKKSDLPDKTVLHSPGKRDGQTIMIRDDSGKILCYSWSAGRQQWDAVGEVVGGAGGSAATSGKVLYEGREYDYVFDVDLDEGRSLKLPYNKGEDPWTVAQAFIHRYQLPQDHLEQVANFITKNADVSSVAINSPGQYTDPFTGGSRYVPSGGVGGSLASNNIDPFTGGGRYVPSGAAASPSPATSQYFPQTVALRFESINKAGILSKLEESNKLVADPLKDDDVVRLVEAVTSPNVVTSDLGPLEKALQWPPERIWPALDVLRLALRSDDAQEMWLGSGKGESIISLLVSFLMPTIPLPSQLLSLRCLANMTCHGPGQKALNSLRNSVISSTVSLAPYPNKNMEIAASTLLINYSILFWKNGDLESQCQLLSAIGTLTLHVKDPEAQFRTLVALGTVLNTSSELRSFATSLDLKSVIERFRSSAELPKVAECASHILKLL